mmetsp:Transcript_11609/g.24617  ORF Transcript_11609/g.24617 Transcript_11609/m.24617 type:complete len:105 (+) Transcript_11609:406-720(+)
MKFTKDVSSMRLKVTIGNKVGLELDKGVKELFVVAVVKGVGQFDLFNKLVWSKVRKIEREIDTTLEPSLTTTGISFDTCKISLPSMMFFFNSVLGRYNKFVNMA